ncbi:hypothetical protein ACFV84_00355 [Kitasatospora sp. NPDC059811]|uniref:hypothetical protein n=1 Tax=Streptomycetaceae TaxID=2062 RepID=UPI0007AF3980|nr:hypothetical protein [Streptomyces sp. MJM8645]
MGSERMRGRRAVVARAPRVAVAVLAGLSLAVGLTASPAAAATTEGNWINEGGPARSPSAMTALWHDNETYEAARGEDDRIWWRHGNGAWQLMPGNARAVRITSNFTFTAGEQEFYVSRGLTNSVRIARTRPGDGRNARYTELPGGGRCESLAIGRGGDPGHLATSPFDPGYAAQQNMAIGCISPNDHQLYLNRSTDGGNTWSGWSHSTGGPSPSDAAPEIHGFPGGEVFAVLSWGSDTAPFKRHMIVMKRVM